MNYPVEVKKWSGGECPEDPFSMIKPIYRGPVDPKKGIRIVQAMAQRFDWSHDGSDDDITGYVVTFDASSVRAKLQEGNTE